MGGPKVQVRFHRCPKCSLWSRQGEPVQFLSNNYLWPELWNRTCSLRCLQTKKTLFPEMFAQTSRKLNKCFGFFFFTTQTLCGKHWTCSSFEVQSLRIWNLVNILSSATNELTFAEEAKMFLKRMRNIFTSREANFPLATNVSWGRKGKHLLEHCNLICRGL